MEWQQILGFYHVARLGSFTKAAEATFRTQSALTQQVKALEAELGCLLVERLGKRQVRLTPQGERMFRFAAGLLDQYQRLKDDLWEDQGSAGGKLTVAAPFTTLYHLLPRVFEAYRRQFPRVELSILDRPQKTVIRLVKEAEVDFGLALESLVPKTLAVRRWQEVHTVLMVPAGHELAALKPLTLEHIARHPLILPPLTHEYHARRQLEALFRDHGLGFQVAMESSNVELSAAYVALGLGISFATVPRDLAGRGQGPLVFLPLTDYFPPDNLAVIFRRDRILTPYQEGFLKLVLEPH